MPEIPEYPFPATAKYPARSWSDVLSHTGRILRRKFPLVRDDSIFEDALSIVAINLLGYWADLDSARLSDGHFSFGFALQQGVHTGVRAILAELRQRDSEYRVGFPLDEDSNDAGYFDVHDPDPTADEVLIRLDENERARAALGELSPDELRDFFNALPTEPARTTADRERVSHTTILRRRRSAARRLVDLPALGRRHGLY